MKPWLEKWEINEPGVVSTGTTGDATFYSMDLSEYAVRSDRAQLAAAAPDMCRALLAVEWNGMAYGNTACCPACGNIWEGEGSQPRETHAEACKLDAALTKADLPDQASRDAARKEIGI